MPGNSRNFVISYVGFTITTLPEYVYSGTTLQMLSCEPYDGCAFPLARKITVIVFLRDDIQFEHSFIMANISTLVQRIKQMVPMAKDLLLSLVAYRDINHTTGHYFDDLATQLFQLVGHIELDHCEAYFYLQEMQLNDVRNLVCIRHATRHGVGTFIQLGRLNVSTLELLDIQISDTNGVSSIIQDENGTYISYPRLIALCLHRGLGNVERPLVFKDAVPFSILRHLKIPSKYPVVDDTFFRGNVATLKMLDMRLDSTSVSMLRAYSVFTPQSHPSLRRVCIEFDDNSVPGRLVLNAEALQFVLGIGTQTSV
ncbi:hypothetical protein GGI19_005378 [Coemansia pectinata]|uniref:Uncharacterized protein n=1 Tax=Coemansia pectinata TaxID=1052879 RepID=A0A9W8GWS7_9FUNG|nr:hypothetical protein GGI19_005378 [Coemansia pectinata]